MFGCGVVIVQCPHRVTAYHVGILSYGCGRKFVLLCNLGTSFFEKWFQYLKIPNTLQSTSEFDKVLFTRSRAIILRAFIFITVQLTNYCWLMFFNEACNRSAQNKTFTLIRWWGWLKTNSTIDQASASLQDGRQPTTGPSTTSWDSH